MRAARFTMNGVLNYRRLVEEGIQRDMAETEKMIKTEESRISYLEAVHKESMRELKKKQEEDMSSLEIDIYYTFIAQTTKEIEKWRRVLSKLKNQYEIKKAELISAFKDKRIMETMKEKMDEGYNNMIKKEDQKVLDEISMGKYNHGRSSLK
ncbi:MAG: flagellar export protein FliJ [Nitrospirae bacterium]|nr:flagellar export protein FliJ [Nitrospirota bacterium]